MTEQKIESLCALYGTPLYVFDVPVLHARVAQLRRSLPDHVSLCYAVKANPFLVRELCGQVERFEICSPGEAALCHRLGVPAETQVISGVYKTATDISRMLQHPNGPRLFTVESERQFVLLGRLSARHRVTIQVLLRVGAGSQFGMDEAEIVQLLRRRTDYPYLDIIGLQYFSGTQKASIKRLKRELESLDAFARSLRDEMGFTVRELEFGPGFPVPYFTPDTFDEQAFFADFSALLDGLRCGAHITLELGRSIAASCGTYLTRVVDVKHSRGQNYAILDGGMHHLAYYGQQLGMHTPPCRPYPSRRGKTQPWNLCGALCTVNDILAKQLPVAGLKCGDLFAFENAGAYCMTEGISLFLSRALPPVVLLQQGGATQLVREALPTDTLNTPCYERTIYYGKTVCYSGVAPARRGLRRMP